MAELVVEAVAEAAVAAEAAAELVAEAVAAVAVAAEAVAVIEVLCLVFMRRQIGLVGVADAPKEAIVP